MGCCGQKRDSLRSNTFPSTNNNEPQGSGVQQQPRPVFAERFHPPVPANSPVSEGPHSIALQYTETSHIVVEGPVTRRRYEFSGAHAIQMVDSRDVGGLLSTRFFTRRQK